jgi:hypothetical protein
MANGGHFDELLILGSNGCQRRLKAEDGYRDLKQQESSEDLITSLHGTAAIHKCILIIHIYESLPLHFHRQFRMLCTKHFSRKLSSGTILGWL